MNLFAAHQNIERTKLCIPGAGLNGTGLAKENLQYLVGVEAWSGCTHVLGLETSVADPEFF